MPTYDRALPRPLALHRQRLGVVPTLTAAALLVWGFQAPRPVATILLAYVLCDWWMWSLHALLDHPAALDNRLFAERAAVFQNHHRYPCNIAHENHMISIDDLCTISGVAAVVAVPSPSLALAVGAHIVFGAVACANHYYCHTRSMGFEVPPAFVIAQDAGVLPSAKHHGLHHKRPHLVNWGFLVGFGALYDRLHNATGHSYAGAVTSASLSSPLAVVVVWRLGEFTGAW